MNLEFQPDTLNATRLKDEQQAYKSFWFSNTISDQSTSQRMHLMYAFDLQWNLSFDITPSAKKVVLYDVWSQIRSSFQDISHEP